MKTIALVTGGSSGIGRSVALQLAKQGIGVVLTYHRQPEAAEAVVADIAKLGGTGVALALDLRSVVGLDAFVAQVRAALATRFAGARAIDYLVNNAGMGGARRSPTSPRPRSTRCSPRTSRARSS
jgi:NAD(P)-dependent dehydrogenase (short-subunit alcohol dehydrogenase family)